MQCHRGWPHIRHVNRRDLASVAWRPDIRGDRVRPLHDQPVRNAERASLGYRRDGPRRDHQPGHARLHPSSGKSSPAEASPLRCTAAFRNGHGGTFFLGENDLHPRVDRRCDCIPDYRQAMATMEAAHRTPGDCGRWDWSVPRNLVAHCKQNGNALRVPISDPEARTRRSGRFDWLMVGQPGTSRGTRQSRRPLDLPLPDVPVHVGGRDAGY